MVVRAEAGADDVGGRGAAPVPDEEMAPLRRINVSGDLTDLFDHRPFFRIRHRGYDRLQVDNYATWIEAELSTARRHNDHLLARYGRAAAELEQLRRAPAPPRAPALAPVTERLGQILRLAAEEAAAITAAGIDEAERIVAEAGMEAAARLRNVEVLREAALAAAEELRRERSEAGGILGRARAEAEELLRAAAVERESAEAAAAARLAAVQAEVDDLRRQRDEARESLSRLTTQVGEALRSATPAGPTHVLEDNHVVDPDAPEQPDTEPNRVAVLAERRNSVAASAS